MDAVKKSLMLISGEQPLFESVGHEYESVAENCSIEGSKMVLKDSDGTHKGSATHDHRFSMFYLFLSVNNSLFLLLDQKLKLRF